MLNYFQLHLINNSCFNVNCLLVNQESLEDYKAGNYVGGKGRMPGEKEKFVLVTKLF